MHPAANFRVTDRQALVARLAEQPFCTVAGVIGGRPTIAHAPVVVREGGAAIDFHLSRRNPLAEIADGARAVIAALGPDAYVSPDWYLSADQVPTWNYRLVEAEGSIERLDEARLTALLDDLSAQEEARLAPKPPWTRHKMGPGRFEAMTRAIVGFRLTVERLEGVDKLSQNKSAEDRAGVVAALEHHPLGALMQKD